MDVPLTVLLLLLAFVVVVLFKLCLFLKAELAVT